MRNLWRLLPGVSGVGPTLRLLALPGMLVLASGCNSSNVPNGKAGVGEKDAGVAACATPEESDRMADQVLQLVNLERASAGIGPVTINARLEDVASDYACRMIEDAFFGHYDPFSGRGPGERAVVGKYLFYNLGENLAAGQETPAEVVRVWMESPAHRDVILGRAWTQAGVAVRFGGEYGIYWVLELADPVIRHARR